MKKIIILFVLVFALGSSASFAAEKIVVFAAASVTDMMDEIMAGYNKANGTDIVGSYAASGVLSRQIDAGAPAAIFISADQKWMDELDKKGLLEKDTRKDYLGNSLVLVASAKSDLKYDFSGKVTLSSLLGAKGKFAIGDPEYVPAGNYAKNALTKLGQWSSLEPSLVLMDNVRVVLTHVGMGSAMMGVVYGSDAAASKDVKILSEFPADSYPAIRYPIAIIAKNKSADVQKFYDYLMTPEVKTIIKKHGFSAL